MRDRVMRSFPPPQVELREDSDGDLQQSGAGLFYYNRRHYIC